MEDFFFLYMRTRSVVANGLYVQMRRRSMLVIGICDDENCVLRMLGDKVDKYMKMQQVEYELRLFHTGQEVLENAENVDLLFLDVDLGDKDGMQIGKMLYEKNRDCKIVMATAMVERMKEAFYFQAFRFLTKPFEDSEIEEVIDSYFRNRVGYQKIKLYENRILYSVWQRDIVYIASYDSYCEFQMKDGRKMRKETSLAQLENELESRIFFRTGRNYIVNMLYIKKYQENAIEIEKQKIRISRRRKTEFEKKYKEVGLLK